MYIFVLRGGLNLKKYLPILLVVFMLLEGVCACGAPSAADNKVLTLFIEALDNRQFAEAYSFLSDSVKESTDGKSISESDFSDKYTSIFDAMDLRTIAYEIVSDDIRDGNRYIEFSMTYHTGLAGDISSKYTAQLEPSNGAWRILWSPALIFPEMDWGDSFYHVRTSARRGDIVAKGGAVAETVDLVTVYAELSEIVGRDALLNAVCSKYSIAASEAEEKLSEMTLDYKTLASLCPGEMQAAVSALSQLLEMTPEQVQEKLKKNVNGTSVVKQYYPAEFDSKISVLVKEIPGIHVATKNFGTARYYPYGDVLAHTVGYVGNADEEELDGLNAGRTAQDGLYTTDSIVGKSALELKYERELRGTDGYYFCIRDSEGVNKHTLYKREKKDGVDLYLSIDLELQLRTDELLELVLYGEDTAGAVVVMNPKDGAVEAIASYPAYDLNILSRGGLSEEEYNEYVGRANKPLINRTIRSLYPPGSAFKTFIGSAAIDLNVIDENYVFQGEIINDYWTPKGYGKWQWPAIKRAKVYFREKPLNMKNAFLHSDNIYFANAALMTGEERLVEYLKKLGMTSKLPFELSVAASQITTENASMTARMLADTGYGQGEVLLTPLQLAVMYCALRNGGDMPLPYIVSAHYVTDGVNYEPIYEYEPSIWIEDAISEHSISVLTPMLQNVVDPKQNGTGSSLRVYSCDVAGKTGTAEIGSDKSREIAWFAGFRLNVDAEDERVVVVMLEVPATDEYAYLKFDIARQLLKLQNDSQ